jgi:hypothetical protein
MSVRAGPGILVLLLAAAIGCSSKPPPMDTGARAAALGYYEALLRQDWSGAYQTLHPDSRSRYSLAQFTRLARTYRQDLGFEPEYVQVRSWQERGEEATVHVVLSGRTATQERRYKETLAGGDGEVEGNAGNTGKQGISCVPGRDGE